MLALAGGPLLNEPTAPAREHDEASVPSFAATFRVWLQIGLTSFGGPAGQIAMMHKVLVEQKRWLDESTYLLALNFCTLLPGPEAMQLATYAGWRLHGVRGGLAAGLLFVAPGAALILVLAALYEVYGNLPIVTAVFTGVKVAVLAIVLEALIKIARRALKGRAQWLMAAASFVAIFVFKVPFPLIVLGAGLIGYWRSDPAVESAPTPLTKAAAVPLSSTLWTAGIWLGIWIMPLLALAAIFGLDNVLTKIAVFFSKLAVVTFGGAYAVLAYMAQDVVGTYGWLKPGEMLDGLGLAETTPGPLILVTEFVGFLAAARHGGGPALLYGLLGALVTLWATFVPCFLYIFAGAPYVEWLKSAPKLKSALAAITAAVVGVILNLSLWFALHVIFQKRIEMGAGPFHLEVPDIANLDLAALSLAALAAFLLFVRHAGIAATLTISALASLLLSIVR